MGLGPTGESFQASDRGVLATRSKAFGHSGAERVAGICLDSPVRRPLPSPPASMARRGRGM